MVTPALTLWNYNSLRGSKKNITANCKELKRENSVFVNCILAVVLSAYSCILERLLNNT